MAVITVDCSQWVMREEVTLETHEAGTPDLGGSANSGVPGREGSKGERPWRGQSSARFSKRMRGYFLCHMHASLGPGAGAGLHCDFDVLPQQQQKAYQPLQREAGETPAKKG